MILFEKTHKQAIFKLYDALRAKRYVHNPYETFYIQDPKLRKINKACVLDRVLHHAVFSKLYNLFDRKFIFDSYSCRLQKGTHRAVRRLQEFFRKESKNNTLKVYVLKCDIRKFFDSINQDILLDLMRRLIKDERVMGLVEVIIRSFGPGLPLGNITSQLFANIYLNELDQFIKQKLGVKYYIRYCDDFVIMKADKEYLENVIPKIGYFLKTELKLHLHSKKITIKPYRQGVDFLGYVSFPYHTVLRLKTKKRMFKKLSIKHKTLLSGEIDKKRFEQTFYSYLGMLKHCNAYKVIKELQVLYQPYFKSMVP